jgi:hypothetical protein
MRVRRGIMATGITIALFGVPFATAGTALATPPATVIGTITGPHTFTLDSGTVVLGELLQPQTRLYGSYVPVTGISTVHSVTTVTTGDTFLPLNRPDIETTFTVIAP